MFPLFLALNISFHS